MKKLLFAITCLFLTTFAAAQKVDLDPIYPRVRFRNLPQHPVGWDYKKYLINVNSGNINEKIYSSSLVKKNITLMGYLKTESEADIAIRFNCEDIAITRIEKKSKINEIKDKNGKVTGKQTLLWVEIEYTFSSVYEVFDLRKNLFLFGNQLDNRSAKYVFSSEYLKNANEASEYFKLNKDKIVANLVTKKYNEYISIINSTINKNIGYPYAKETITLWILDSKKHPEYTDNQKLVNELKDLLMSIQHEKPLDNIKETATPIIEYLNELPLKYNSEEKGDKKMRYCAYYNLGMLYLYLDMPDEAYEMGKKLFDNGYDEKDGEKIQSKATALKALFEKNKIYTRHFVRDIEDIPENTENLEVVEPSNKVDESEEKSTTN